MNCHCLKDAEASERSLVTRDELFVPGCGDKA
jgi:hypothetical protein